MARGAEPGDLNVYAAYRGNWEVMLRGLYTNRLARNVVAPDLPPGWTELADGSRLPAFEAADRLRAAGGSSILLAGERYGMGSSRDWAAKGPALLGVRAVVARSFERIHRQNLIGMGVLPVAIDEDWVPEAAGIGPADRFRIDVGPVTLSPGCPLEIGHLRPGGGRRGIRCRAAVETLREVELLRQGGVIPALLARRLGPQRGAPNRDRRTC
ncbi:hypothetical protein [Roseivivax sp. CAU 1761]